jgi:hypothetical protein
MVKGSAKQEKQNYGVLVSNMVERYCQSENDHESIFHLYELYPNCLPWELLSCYSLIFFSFQHNIMPLHTFSIDITLGCLLLLVHACRDVSFNNLSGDIPSSFSSLSNLSTL